MATVIVFFIFPYDLLRETSPYFIFCSAPLLITCLLRGSTRVPPRSGGAARRRPSARGLR